MTASRSSGGCSQNPPSSTIRILSCDLAVRRRICGTSAVSSALWSSRRSTAPSATSTYAWSTGSSHGVSRLMAYTSRRSRRFSLKTAIERRRSLSVTRAAGQRLDVAQDPRVLVAEVGRRSRRVDVLRQVEDLRGVGEVARPDAGQVPRRVADRVGHEHVEREPAVERDLERAAQDGAEVGAEVRVGLPHLHRRAAHLDRQHAGRVRQLLREVHLEVAEDLAPRRLPGVHRGELGILQQVPAGAQGRVERQGRDARRRRKRWRWRSCELLPHGRPLLHERRDPFVRVRELHQVGEVELLRAAPAPGRRRDRRPRSRPAWRAGAPGRTARAELGEHRLPRRRRTRRPRRPG